MRKGLVERRAVAADRRARALALSAKGRRLVDAFRKRRGAIFVEALERMSGAEQAQVLAALGRLLGSLEDADAQTGTTPRGVVFESAA